MGVELDKWIEKVKRCEYLSEDELKALCEYVSAYLCDRTVCLRIHIMHVVSSRAALLCLELCLYLLARLRPLVCTVLSWKGLRDCNIRRCPFIRTCTLLAQVLTPSRTPMLLTPKRICGVSTVQVRSVLYYVGGCFAD